MFRYRIRDLDALQDQFVDGLTSIVDNKVIAQRRLQTRLLGGRLR